MVVDRSGYAGTVVDVAVLWYIWCGYGVFVVFFIHIVVRLSFAQESPQLSSRWRMLIDIKMKRKIVCHDKVTMNTFRFICRQNKKSLVKESRGQEILKKKKMKKKSVC